MASVYNINTDIVNKKYGSSFVGYFPMKLKNGGWSERPGAVFYQPNPDTTKGHSNYFALYFDYLDKLFITNADFITDGWVGMESNSGELFWSEYCHDFHTAKDGSCWIDGGFDYQRYAPGRGKLVKLNVKDGKVYVEQRL